MDNDHEHTTRMETVPPSRLRSDRMDDTPKQLKPLICPKCGEHPGSILERMAAYVEWDLDEGMATGEGSAKPGESISVRAVCDCGHQWASSLVRDAHDVCTGKERYKKPRVKKLRRR
jgi:hypothetical protein